MYNTVSNISDTNMVQLNYIMTGFGTSDLQSIVFKSTTSINALGAINSWSTDQVYIYII